MQTTEQESLARRMAKHCLDGKCYYAGNENPINPRQRYIRVYGVSAKNDHGMIGLAHLLSDEELGSIGLRIERFTGRGIVFDESHERNKPPGIPRYYTCYAMVVAIWRLLGKPDTQPVYL